MTSDARSTRSDWRIPLESDDGDSGAFIDVAARLITAVALQRDVPLIYTIHVDHWFGSRWLGFRGKLLGVAGVRNKTLRRSLPLPPFHPNRILSGAEYHRRADGEYEFAGTLEGLHRNQSSAANLDRGIRRNTLHAWYSGDTVATNKGVLMTYLDSRAVTKAWYVMFDGERDWRLEEHVGITRDEVAELLDASSLEKAG